MESDDFSLCDGVFIAIANVTGGRLDVASEPLECRTVTLVWHSLGLIENGGFNNFLDGEFVGDPSFELTLQAYIDIGAQTASQAFRDALEYRDGKVRSQSVLSKLEERFYDAEPEIVEMLGYYCRANKAAITRFLQKEQ